MGPDGFINVNLQLLQELGLLSNSELEISDPESLSQQFHVIETSEKVTLFNKQFAVWIIPQTDTELPSTLILIALIQNLMILFGYFARKTPSALEDRLHAF